MIPIGTIVRHARATVAVCSHGFAKLTRRVLRYSSDTAFNTPTATTKHVRNPGNTPPMITYIKRSHNMPAYT